MGFLEKLLTGVLKNILVSITTWIYDFFKTKKEREVLEEKNLTQAQKVEAISEEVKKLLREGKEVPQELKDKLREESRILVNGTFD